MPLRTLAQAGAYAASGAAASLTTDTTPRATDVVCAIAINDFGDGPPSVSGGAGTAWKIRDYFAQNSASANGVGADVVVYTRTLNSDGAVSATATNPAIDSGVFLLVAVLSGVAEVPAALAFAGLLEAYPTIAAPAVTGVRGGGVLLNAAGTSYATSAGQTLAAPSSAASSVVTGAYDNALARLAVDGSPPAAAVASGSRSFAMSPDNGAVAVSVLFEPATVAAGARAGQMFLGA